MDAREKILETATKLFSSQGFGSTSLSQVAKEAKVSKALIFWHFENKERLFQSALQRTLEPYFINVVDALEGLDELGQILKLIDLYYAFVRDHTQSVRFMLSLILRDEKQPDDAVARLGELSRIYRNLLTDIIEGGRQKGIFRTEVKPSAEAGLVMYTLYGALVQGFLGHSPGENEEMLTHLRAVVVERLQPRPTAGGGTQK